MFMMFSFTSPTVLPKLFPSILWHVRERGKDKTIYLTFDDGPMPGVTDWVLSLLQQYNARATFFIVGNNVKKYPELFRQICQEGHKVGNHTYHHLKGWNTKNKDYFDDIEKAGKILRSEYFRPPYAKIKPSQIYALYKTYQIVLWDVLSRDFDANLEPHECWENVVQNTRPGSIVVFHDSYKAEKNLRGILPAVLEYYSAMNYTFAALP